MAWDGRAPGDGGGGGTDFVPVGTVGFTVTTGYGGTRVYTSDDGNAIVFGSRIEGNDYPSQYIFADPFAGIYWSDGSVDATDGINLFLWDNGTIALSGELRIANGVLNMIGQSIKWNASDRDSSGTESALGDAQDDGTAPNLVGVRGYTSAERLALDVTATADHYMVFDADLGKPVWSDGAGGWVDAMGTSV